jgi:hypothetical protein
LLRGAVAVGESSTIHQFVYDLFEDIGHGVCLRLRGERLKGRK